MQTNFKAPVNLPPAIEAYFAAERTNAEAVARCFTADAVVIDEQREHRGQRAITRWKREATAKYRYTSVPIAVATVSPEAIVTARLTGEFPGSPLELRYRFVLDGGRIARLEITP